MEVFRTMELEGSAEGFTARPILIEASFFFFEPLLFGAALVDSASLLTALGLCNRIPNLIPNLVPPDGAPAAHCDAFSCAPGLR